MRKKTYFDIRLFLVQNRAVLTVVMTAISSLSLGIFLLAPFPIIEQVNWLFLIIFVITNTGLVFICLTPKYYERLQFIDEILPIIHKILGLDPSARLTLHHIQDKKKGLFEQVTHYYPKPTGKGRVFSFTQGITGQAFCTKKAQCYRILDSITLEEDYQKRWSFTDDDISRLTQDRKSFFAFPIGQEGIYAKAVLYIDSADSSVLSEDKFESINNSLIDYFLPLLEKLLESNSSVNKVQY